MSLLTVGTVAFDAIETPFGKAEMVIGGACTYISWSASYFTNNIQQYKALMQTAGEKLRILIFRNTQPRLIELKVGSILK